MEAAAPGPCGCGLSSGQERRELDILTRKTGLVPRNSMPLISKKLSEEVYTSFPSNRPLPPSVGELEGIRVVDIRIQ